MKDNVEAGLWAACESESARLYHYYIGAEHVLLALLRRPLLGEALQHLGVSPDYVAYRLEQSLGQAPERRYWEGFRLTPRCTQLLEMAQSEAGGGMIQEPHLLAAFLREGQSLAWRLLEGAGGESAWILSWLKSHTQLEATKPPLQLHSYIPLAPFERAMLQELLKNYAAATIQQELSGGQSLGKRFIATLPLELDPGAPPGLEFHMILRLDASADILREKHRADQNLIPTQLGVEAVVINPQHRLGLLQYRPVSADGPLADLLGRFNTWDEAAWEAFLREKLYLKYGDSLWKKRGRYRFPLWREYEAFLPPSITLEPLNGNYTDVIHPLGDWIHLNSLKMGMRVEARDFTVGQIWPHRKHLLLQAGLGPEAVYQGSRILCTDPDELESYRPGQHLRRLKGMVSQTRHGALFEALSALDPDFLALGPRWQTPIGPLPNPLHYLPSLLAHEVEGHLSLIHGRMRAENILIGDEAELIDWSEVRQGSPLFDWISLELSLISDILAEDMYDTWEWVWAFAASYRQLNQGAAIGADQPWALALNKLGRLRALVTEVLPNPGHWGEYQAGLVCLALGQLSQSHFSLGARRALMLVAAIATEAFQEQDPA
jgi:hypothetical protein